MEKKVSNSLKARFNNSFPIPNSVRIFSYVLSVLITTVGIGYYVFAANTSIGTNITTTGTLSVGSSSLFTGAVNASSTLQVTGGTTLYGSLTSTSGATSTFANGFDLSNGCFSINGTCVGGGGGGSGTVNSGTAGQISFYDSTGTAVSGTSTVFISTAGKFGIGTTTPSQLLSVQGNGLFSGDISVANINATGTIDVSAGSAYTYNGANIIIASTTLENYFFGGAGNLTMTGSGNLGTGIYSLIANTTGSFNTGNGYDALFSNTSGINNTAIGFDSLYSNTTGGNNTSVGLSAVYSNTTGGNNTAIGSSALQANTTGSKNTAVGQNTLSDLNITTDNGTGGNTAIGYNTGLGIITGLNNTILGANVTGLDSALSNNIIIADGEGNQRINVWSNGNVGIGTTTPGSLLAVHGNGLFSGTLSVASLIATGTTQLNGVTYTWPSSDGSNTNVLSTNGSGVLSWTAGGGGSSLFTDGGATSYLTSTDNLGVGTTSTAFKFGVQGNGLFSGNITASNITATGTLTLAGNLLPSVSPASTSASVIKTLVNSSTVISDKAMAIGGDGFPVIAYYESTNDDLVVTKCANASCSSISATTTVDSLGDVGQFASIATTTDGFPIISYYDVTNENLKVAKCGNASCSSGNTITTVDAAGTIGQYSSIAVPADNLPVISYYAATGGDLKVIKCGNASCSSGNTITIADPTSSGPTALALGADGFPVIGHFNGSGNVLRVTKCGNASCTSTTTTEFAGALTNRIAARIGSDGNPVFAFQDSGTQYMAIFICANASCTSGSSTLLLGFTDSNPSLVIGTDGFPVVIGDTGGYAKCADLSCASFKLYNFDDTVTYTSALLANDGFVNIAYSDGSTNLKFVDCPNANCSSGITISETAYVATSLGSYLSMALDASGNPMIAYRDETNQTLGFVHCGNSDCTSGNASTTLDTGNVGSYTSMATTTDGFAVIAYYDDANADLKVAKCNNADCTAPTITTVDNSVNSVGTFNSITIDPATGFPIIAYQDSTSTFIWVAQCGNAACSAGNTLTLVEQFDDFTSSNSYTSIAIASDGKPMLLYRSSSTGNVFLTKCDDMACVIGGNSSTTVYASNGSNMKLARAGDGNPVLAYRDETNAGALVLVKCGSATCNTGNSTTTVDTVASDSISLKIGANGFPSLSYRDVTNTNLKFIQCTNATCGTSAKNTVDSGGNVGNYSGLEVRSSDGFPVIAHYNSSNTDIKLNACNDVACANEDTSVNRKIRSNLGVSFLNPSIAKGSDNLPIISYHDDSNADLKVLHCDDTSCSTSTETTLDSTGDVGDWSAIAIGGDNLPVIAYQDVTNTALKVAHCSVNDCSSSTLSTIEASLGGQAEYISIAISADGFPVISYYVNGVSLKVAKCGNAACSSGNTVSTIEAGANTGPNSSIAIGSDGFPVIAYVNRTNSPILRIAKCGNASCSQVTSTISLIQHVIDAAKSLALSIGQTGFPVIAYSKQDWNSGSYDELEFIECSNAGCTGNNNSFNTVYSFYGFDNQMSGLSMKIDSDGLPVILFMSSPSGSVLAQAPTVIKCGSFDCASGNRTSTIDNLTTGGATAMALGSDGNPILAYITIGNGVQYVKCGDAACQSFSGANFSGGSDIGTSALFFHNAYIESIYANSIKIKRFDLAEDYYSRDKLEVGEIVSLDADEPLHIHKANSSDGNRIIGIISTEPALTLTDYLATPTNDKNYPVALSGRVPTKVNTEGGAIAIGDPLAISNQSGVAKKASLNGGEKIIGYALEKYNGPTSKNNGKILVFVSSQMRLGTDVMSVIQQSGDMTSILANVIDSVRGWLTSMKITIEDGIMTVKNLVAEQVTAKKLCLDEVCIDKVQLQSILSASGNPQPAAAVEVPAVEAPITGAPSEPVVTDAPAETPSADTTEDVTPVQ